jgi:N-acetylneuraminate synthase
MVAGQRGEKKMKTIKIADRLVGKKQPTFIIAEAGVNHNGKLSLAKKLVDIAVLAGVDAVKFQTFKSEEVTTKNAKIPKYQEKNLGKSETQLEMIKKFELPYEKFIEIKKYCDNQGLIFLSTPHSDDAIDFLDPLIPAYKIGSGDLTNLPFLEKTAKKNKPIILGTGMSTLKEVKIAINTIKIRGNNQIIALHCTTNYPCPLDEVNLNAMITMQEKLDCLIGYSDHTLGIMIPIMATTLGAVVIEKHFTLDRNLPGPDHKISLEPNDLKKMVIEIRNVQNALGTNEKKPTKSEKEIMKLVRKSIVAHENIKKGFIIKKRMLTFKRPGTGIPPSKINQIIGKKASRQILKDEIFQLNMVE